MDLPTYRLYFDDNESNPIAVPKLYNCGTTSYINYSQSWGSYFTKVIYYILATSYSLNNAMGLLGYS